MTLTSPRIDCRRNPRWSEHPYGPDDRPHVLQWFAEKDFFFRTAQPDTRPPWEIDELLGDDTAVLLADDDPVGLYAVETIGTEHASHVQLALRLRAAAPRAWWRCAFNQIVEGLRWRSEVVRLEMLVGEFDRRGHEAVLSLGLTYEGTLADVVVHDGGRYGWGYYSRIWVPS